VQHLRNFDLSYEMILSPFHFPLALKISVSMLPSQKYTDFILTGAGVRHLYMAANIARYMEELMQ